MQNNQIDNSWMHKQLYGDELILGNLYRQINKLICDFSSLKGSEADANLIFGSVWLGNMKVAHDYNFVTSKRIGYIINVTDDVYNKFPFIDYTQFPIKDVEACYQNLFNMIDNGADLINKAVKENKPILIHCKRGHHRSASIITFYLMKYQNMSLVDAIHLIKKKRPTAFRRFTCMLNNLILYEYQRIK